MRNKLGTILSILGFSVVLAVSAFTFFSAPSKGAETPITGEYHQVHGPKGMTFEATVTHDKIVVNLTMNGGEGDDDVHGTYWDGSIDTSDTSGTFTSIADKWKLDTSLLGSQDNKKKFTYEDGVLSFEFAMDLTGTKTTVRLTK